MSVKDVDQVADLVLRLDGPYEHEDLAAAASLVSELVRRLNHATRGSTHPTTVDAVVGRLGGAVRGLPQLCRQLAHNLTRVAADPMLASDTPDLDPEILARTAAAELQAVAAGLESAHRGMADALNATSRLYERA